MSGFVLLAAWHPAPADAQGDVRTTYAVVREGRVTFQTAGVDEPFRVLFLSDTHFTVEDSRGEPYRKYSERMGGAAVRPENYGVSNGRERQLLKALAQARKDSVELVVLGGDMLNFPSLASVDSLLAIMTHSGLDWVYIAGNHDWHYEGEAGTSAEQRSRWESTALAPLYQGGDPLARAEVRHGVNLVFIDNSTLEVTPGQLDFLRREIARRLPMVLFMHVPVYFRGRTSTTAVAIPSGTRPTTATTRSSGASLGPRRDTRLRRRPFASWCASVPKSSAASPDTPTSAPLTSTTGDFSTWSVPITAAMP